MNYFRGLRNLLVFAVAIFTVGIIFGTILPQYFTYFIRFITGMGSDALRHGRFNMAVSILAQNLMAFYILVITGALFGILPTLALAFNGAVIGAAIRHSGLDQLSDVLIHIAAHGILELPAYFICAAIALHCGQASLHRLGLKEIVSRWHLGTRVFLRVVFPMLIIAAFIEAFVSSSVH